jgi:hypothetical protein
MEYTAANRPAVDILVDHGYRISVLGEDGSLTPIDPDRLGDSAPLDMLFCYRGLAGALGKAA